MMALPNARFDDLGERDGAVRGDGNALLGLVQARMFGRIRGQHGQANEQAWDEACEQKRGIESGDRHEGILSARR
jgi:hypothetical protein